VHRQLLQTQTMYDNDEEEQVWEENQKPEKDLTANWNQWHRCIWGPTKRWSDSSHALHNNISVNDRPHIWQWSHRIVRL
jgi:hypothetical protein